MYHIHFIPNKDNIKNIININKILNNNITKKLFTLFIKGDNKSIRKYLLYNNIDYKNKQEIKKIFNNNNK